MNRSPAPRNAPRRVLVVSPQPCFEDRGTPIAVRELVTALAGLGFEVDLATYPMGRALRVPGVCVRRTANPLRLRSVPIGFSLRKALLDVLLFFTVLRLLRRHRYFSVHGVEEGGFIAALLAPRYGVAVVYDMQSAMPEELKRHRIFRPALVQRALVACERWLLRRAAVIVCSSGLGERIRAAEPAATLREWRYPALAIGARAQDEAATLRRQLGIATDARVVLYAGTFEAYQGLGELLAAIPQVTVEVPGTVFVLVGAEQRGRASVARQAARLGLGGNLRVVERQPVERMDGFMALADVLVAPRAAGQNVPLKVFHYMAAGRAIVVTGMRRSHPALGEECALVADHDPAAIAGAISRVLRDQPLARGLAARARAYAETHLHPARFAGSVGELCEALGAEVREAVGV